MFIISSKTIRINVLNSVFVENEYIRMEISKNLRWILDWMRNFTFKEQIDDKISLYSLEYRKPRCNLIRLLLNIDTFERLWAQVEVAQWYSDSLEMRRV